MHTSPGHLLLLVHRIPYPPDKGDKIRSYNELRFLARQGWKIHLCAFSEEAVPASHVRALEELCETCRIFPLAGLRRKAILAGALLRGKSLSVAAFYRRSAQRYVDDLLTAYPIRAVLCFCAPMAEYVFRSLLNRESENSKICTQQNTQIHDSTNQPVLVMDLVDVDSQKWALYAQKHAGLRSWIYHLENTRLREYEESIIRAFAATVVVSEAEARELRSRAEEPGRVRSMGNGVDLDFFSPQTGTRDAGRSSQCRIVFCGQMDYFPNIEAVTWFVHAILPELKQMIPGVRFQVVGAGPGQAVRGLASVEGVEVTGRVDDVRPYVHAADVSVAPIRTARGIQNKILEAMASGKPVVATRQAFEGIEAEPGRDLVVVEENPREFADAVARLCNEPETAAAVGRRARERMEREYSWQAQLAPLKELVCGRGLDADWPPSDRDAGTGNP